MAGEGERQRGSRRAALGASAGRPLWPHPIHTTNNNRPPRPQTPNHQLPTTNQLQMEKSFDMQRSMGMQQDGESDELKRVIIEGNPYLLVGRRLGRLGW